MKSVFQPPARHDANRARGGFNASILRLVQARHLAVFSVVAILYALAFLLLYPRLGDITAVLAVLPVALSGALFGLRSGLVAGLAAPLVSLLLIGVLGAPDWADLTAHGSLGGWAAILLTGTAAGLLSDARFRYRTLEQTRSRQDTILEATPDLVGTAGPDGRILYINAAGRRLLGLREDEEVTRLHVSDFLTPAAFERLIEESMVGARLEDVWTGEAEILSRDGRKIPVSEVVLVHRNPQGKVQFYSTICREISLRKRIEAAERQQRVLAEALRDTAEVLTSDLTFDELLDRILINAERVVAYDVASILLIEGGVASTVRSRSLDSAGKWEHKIHSQFSIDETPNLRLILETGQAAAVPATHDSPDWVHYPETSWIHSHITAPIRVKDAIIGFVSLESSTPHFYTPEHAGRLQAFADQAGVALENSRLLAEAERRANEFAVLYEMAGDLATQRDLQSLMDVLVVRAAALLNVRGGALTQYIPERNNLELAVVRGLDLPAGLRLQMGEGLSGRVAETRQPLIIDPYGQWEGRLENPQVEALTSALGVPMLHAGELIGVLTVFEVGGTHCFTDADIRLLSLFAGQAASALHNARLFDETRRRLAEMEGVNKVSTALRISQRLDEMLPVFLDETLTALGAGVGSVWLFEEADACLRQAAARGWFAAALEEARTRPVDRPRPAIQPLPGETIATQVFQSGEALLILDCSTLPGEPGMAGARIPSGWGGACLPIRAEQAAVGVLFVCVELPRQISSNELHLLKILAEMAGAAIHRASLYEQTRKHLRRLDALHTVDMTINASLDLELVFGILLDHAIAQLEVEAADVRLFNTETQTLELSTGRGFSTSALAPYSLRIGQGPGSRAILERRTLILSGSELAETGLAWACSEGFQFYCGAPLVAKGQVKGVFELFSRKPLKPDADWLDFAETLAGQAALATESAQLFEGLQRSNLELTLAYDATIEGWSRALELRDKETQGHTQRVLELTMRLAKAMGMSEAQLVQIRRGALLHDIGKMGIPDSILLKPGPLTDEEQAIMRRHPVYAYQLLSSIAFLRPALDIPYYHHERWDGMGYPVGLRGEQIPLAARIFSVVDVWDALRSSRPYSPGWTEEEALRYIVEESGKHFDPQVVEAFVRLF